MKIFSKACSGAALRELRLERGLSQPHVAKAYGKNGVTVARISQVEGLPTVSRLVASRYRHAVAAAVARRKSRFEILKTRIRP